MAEVINHVCNRCSASIEAWSDGNPYYLDENGTKEYAYHPDHEQLEKCIGNDSPHLCLGCGAEFMVDYEAPSDQCPKCHSQEIADTFELDGRKCPFCKAGTFVRDSDFFVVS